MVSLGCSKNLVDGEVMLGILKNNGHEIVSNKNIADVIIVNTCAFIETAQQEAVDTILEMAKLKETGLKKLIVTGCLANRYRDEIIKEIPEVDIVLSTSSIDDILDAINCSESKIFDRDFGSIDYLNTTRLVSTAKPTAYVKIAEGCDNFCTYCIIPKLRGRYISRRVEDVVNEVNFLAENGYSEIILVAQDVTVYGKDIYGKKSLSRLIREISKVDKIKWIRLLYCYPEEIDDELIYEMRDNEKLIKYFDIPIQHASDKILKMMGRRGNRKCIEDVIHKIRDIIPDVLIRTSLIVGFPGESEEDFEILKEFVKNIKFDRLGVFKYSREEGTPSYDFSNQVDESLKESRYNDIMSIQNLVSRENNKKRMGEVCEAVVEGVSDDGIFYEGRTKKEVPDIDGKVYFVAKRSLSIGEVVLIKIINTDDYDLIGVVLDDEDEFAK